MDAEKSVLFFGQDLSDDACEMMMLKRFGTGERAFKKHFKLELGLQQSKWFDYRILHPVVATYLFAAEYTKAYRRYYAMIIDQDKAQYVKGFKGADAWESTNSGGFIKARQQADRMGIPYDFYISTALDFLYIKKWKHIARPCHLYADDVIEAISQRWSEYSRCAMTLAKESFFKDPSNADRPEFVAHQTWIQAYIDRSKVKQFTIESMSEQGYIVKPE